MDTDNKLPHWVTRLANFVLDHIEKQQLTNCQNINLLISNRKKVAMMREILNFEFIIKIINKKYPNIIPYISFLDTPEEDEAYCKNIVSKLTTFILPQNTSNYILKDSIHIKFDHSIDLKQINITDKKLILPCGQIRIKGITNTLTDEEQIDAILSCFDIDIIRWLTAHQGCSTKLTFSFDKEIIKLYRLFDEAETRYFNTDNPDNLNDEFEKITYELSKRLLVNTTTKPFRPDFIKLSTILQFYKLDISSAYAYNVHLLKTDYDKTCFTHRAEHILNWVNKYAPDYFKFSLNTTPITLDLEKQERNFMHKIYNFIKDYADEVEIEKIDEIGKRFEKFAREESLEYEHAKIILYQHLINKENGPTFSSFIKYLDRNKLLMLLRGHQGS